MQDMIPMVSRSVSQLDPGEKFLLWAIRSWVCCCKADLLPALVVRRAFAQIRIVDGAAALEAALMWVARGTRRPLGIHCPNCPALGSDEDRLIEAVAAAQHGDIDVSRAHLHALLPPLFVDRVLPPLRRVGLLLAVEGVVLPAPGGDPASPRLSAGASPATVH